MSFWRRAARSVDRQRELSADQRQQAVVELERRLHIDSVLDLAMHDPSRVFALVVDADDIAAATAAIQCEFSVDEAQATAVLDLQWRRITRSERERIRARHEELVRNLTILKQGPVN